MTMTIVVGVIGLLVGWYMGSLLCPFWALREKKEKKPRVEERVVFGETSKADLYSVWVPDKNGAFTHTYSGIHYMDGEYVYYLTCEQAHKEHPDRAVSIKQALIVGEDYLVGEFKTAKVQPKPKVAKGRK